MASASITNPKLPTHIAELSKELLVAREIYAIEKEGVGAIVPYDTLVKRLGAEHLADEDSVSRALDTLFDQGIVKAEWTQRGGRNVRGFAIAGEARKFVVLIYENTE